MEDVEEELTSPWLNAFCVVTFDLEYGQKLEYIYPKITLTEQEISNICFLAFPDSTSQTGDTSFTFRIRKGYVFNEYQHGYVFFRQKKDSSIDRGYLQKSIVLLTNHSHVGLYKEIASIVGSLYFEHGTTLLEAAFQNVLAWPSPIPGKTYELPILGKVLSFHIPYTSTPHIIDSPVKQTSRPSSPLTSKEQIVSNLQSINIYTTFSDVFQHLWLLWELVLINSPILVISPSPTQCSDAVMGLVSLISPIDYAGDYRPYFTIHDSDFKEYVETTASVPNIILGVTNPYFSKTLAHWPTTVKTGTSQVANEAKRKMQLQGSGVNSVSGNGTQLTQQKQNVKSVNKASVAVDKDMLKKFNADPQQFDGNLQLKAAINNEILRRYFLRLTENFLIPLERYVTSLMPLAKLVSAFRSCPILKPFVKVEFLELLNKETNFITGSKKKDIDLYSNFIESENFKKWYGRKQEVVTRELNTLYIKLLCKIDLNGISEMKSDIEIVDLYLRIQEQMKEMPANSAERERLEKVLDEVVTVLPEDLQTSMLRNREQMQATDTFRQHSTGAED